MRMRIALAVVAAACFSASGHALQSPDSQPWIEHAQLSETSQLRWTLSTQTATGQTASGDILFDDDPRDLEDYEITRLAGQVDFYPFGDEFFVSAGAVRPIDGDPVPHWAPTNGDPAWAALPHANLLDQEFEGDLEQLTRYFGAGVTLRELNAWSLTLQGGAYFGDSADDRLHIAGFEAVERASLQDDLDTVERAAVGDTQARGVKPVGHLVFRRRF